MSSSIVPHVRFLGLRMIAVSSLNALHMHVPVAQTPLASLQGVTLSLRRGKYVAIRRLYRDCIKRDLLSLRNLPGTVLPAGS